MSNEITTLSPDAQAFELVQRQAKMLASSTLVPKDFQGNMSNCAIGLNIAKRLGADPFMVIQNIDIIHGRPSFRATFLIAMVNASGRFTPLQYRMTGEGQTRACVAHCKTKDTGEVIEGPEITMAMAKAEGWSTKNGSKWLTMPELMLRYRAAAFFARIYAPDITLGMLTAEEAYDITPERVAVGRVLDESERVIRPFDDVPAIEAEPPAPDGEPIQESPVEASPDTERQQLIEDIKETCAENEVTFATFGGKVKAAGIMEAKDTLRDVAIGTLRTIHANRLAIINGTFKP